MAEAEGVEWPEPLHIVRPNDEHSKLFVVEENIAQLAAIKGPVAVVSVVGVQRTGKSTLMNLLHGRNPTKGFGLGHMMEACTTGIWAWAKRHPRNPKMTILLVDTEGLDTPHVSQGYNWTLSALVLTLTSYYIYQTRGSIESSATDRLAAILKVSEQLYRGTGATDRSRPAFLWLLRDHQLEMAVDANETMMSKLNEQEQKALARNFRKSVCNTLPRPVDRDEKLRDVEKMEYKALTDVFREDYQLLERDIFKDAMQPRILGGHPVTGETLAMLCGKYTSAVNARDGVLNQLSELPTQRQMVARMAGERGFKAGKEVYREGMQQVSAQLPVSSDVLASAHKKAEEEAWKEFDEEAGLAKDDETGDTKPFRVQLEQFIALWESGIEERAGMLVHVQRLTGGLYGKLTKENAEKSKKQCQHALKELYEPLSVHVQEGGFSNVAAFYAAVEELNGAYQNHPQVVGPSALKEWTMLMSERVQSDAALVGTLAVRKDLESKLTSSVEALSQQFKQALQEQETSLHERAEKQDQRMTLIQSDLTQQMQMDRAAATEGMTKNHTLISQANEKITSMKEELDNVTRGLETEVTTREGLSQKVVAVETSVVDMKHQVELAGLRQDAALKDLGSQMQRDVDGIKEELERNTKQAKHELEMEEERRKQAEEKMRSSMQDQEKRTMNAVGEALHVAQEATQRLTTMNTHITGQLESTKASLEQRMEQMGQQWTSKMEQSSKALVDKHQVDVEQMRKYLEDTKQVQTQLIKQTADQWSERLASNRVSLKEAIEGETKRAIAAEAMLSAFGKESREFANAVSERAANAAAEALEKRIQDYVVEATGGMKQELAASVDDVRATVKTLAKEQKESIRVELSQLKEAVAGSNDTMRLMEEHAKQRETSMQSALEAKVEASMKQWQTLSLKMDNENQAVLQWKTRMDAMLQQASQRVVGVEQDLQRATEQLQSLATTGGTMDQRMDAHATALRTQMDTLGRTLAKLEERINEVGKEAEASHLATDSIWDSMGVLSGRVTEMQAWVDKQVPGNVVVHSSPASSSWRSAMRRVRQQQTPKKEEESAPLV